METIDIGQSLVITVFSMTVVFLILLGISFLIDLMRILVEKLEKEPEAKVEPMPIKEEVKLDKKEDLDEEELVAVIAAAVAASMGLDVPDINIKSIKRVDSGWKNRARNEQVFKNI